MATLTSVFAGRWWLPFDPHPVDRRGRKLRHRRAAELPREGPRSPVARAPKHVPFPAEPHIYLAWTLLVGTFSGRCTIGGAAICCQRVRFAFRYPHSSPESAPVENKVDLGFVSQKLVLEGLVGCSTNKNAGADKCSFFHKIPSPEMLAPEMPAGLAAAKELLLLTDESPTRILLAQLASNRSPFAQIDGLVCGRFALSPEVLQFVQLIQRLVELSLNCRFIPQY